MCLRGKLLSSLHPVGSLPLLEMGPQPGSSLGVKVKEPKQPFCVCPQAASVTS